MRANTPKVFQQNTGPLVFQIGFNRCGSGFLVDLFNRNNYQGRHWQNGTLAEDINYSKLNGSKPLTPWPNTTFFANMERVHDLHRPALFGFKEYEFLHKWFPDAVFILNTRHVEGWINSRLNHLDGLYANLSARHLGVQLNDLPQLWRDDWEEHITAVRAYFQSYDRFIEYNIDTAKPAELVAFLSPWFTLPIIPRRRVNRRIKKDQIKKVFISPLNTKPDTGFIDNVVAHCLGGRDLRTLDKVLVNHSNIHAEWDGETRITDASGAELPFRFDQAGRCFSQIRQNKADRIEGVINDIHTLGFKGPLSLDMQDARWFGAGIVPPAPWPLLVYNRREGAKNLVLWPLPGYHTPGLETFVHHQPIDPIPFDDKSDMAIWRGNLTGNPNKALAPKATDFRGASAILEDITLTSDENRLQELQGELMQITRYNLVARTYISDRIDAALTLGKRHRIAAESPILALFCKPRVKPEWFFSAKYILSLSGNDTGSNFLLAANSNGVVLKEQDGWEVFYSAEFNPWEHYIPLELGAQDLEEKLDWAQANPAKCKEMSRAASDVCARFANPANRRAILSGVLHGLGMTRNK